MLFKFKTLFQVFINQSANFNAQDENGCTALYYAASKNNYFAVVCLLAVSSIDINVSIIRFYFKLERLKEKLSAPTS